MDNKYVVKEKRNDLLGANVFFFWSTVHFYMAVIIMLCSFSKAHVFQFIRSNNLDYLCAISVNCFEEEDPHTIPGTEIQSQIRLEMFQLYLVSNDQ